MILQQRSSLCILAAVTVFFGFGCYAGYGPPPPPPPVECGFNAHPAGGGCACDQPYTWCDGAQDNCCARFTTVFDVTLVGAHVLPYVNRATLEPWDWDGQVPQDLLDAVQLLADLTADPEIDTFNEVLQLVDQYAPGLLAPYVPPDPFVDVYVDAAYLGPTSTWADTYSPAWNEYYTVDLSNGQSLDMDFWDEDIAVDDVIAGYSFTLGDLQTLSGRGGVVLGGYGGLFDLTIAIDPGTPTGAGQTCALIVTNYIDCFGPYTIESLYIAPMGTSAWGANLLSGTIGNGQTANVSIPAGGHDYLAIDNTGDYYIASGVCPAGSSLDWPVDVSYCTTCVGC